MDGSAAEHSDSDSGESWTLLENTSTFGDDAPDFPENSSTSPSFEKEQAVNHNDEDTDGISIISDSDPESSPCDLSCDKCKSQESRPIQPHDDDPYIITEPLSPNIGNESGSQHDFLADNNVKHKTYVHRRNKRLSTVLNIIMLGSVITAAGVAIGHMWGARNECTMHTPPSVNKILSNLYKLQEENAFLRNKLKELTLASNIHLQQQKKIGPDKVSAKQHRCKKIFEEPLHQKSDKGFKCIDVDNNKSEQDNNVIELPIHEKEFLEEVNKLKNVYDQNKTWLDAEIADKLKLEDKAYISHNNSKKIFKSLPENQKPKSKSHRVKNLHLQKETNAPIENFTVIKQMEIDMGNEIKTTNIEKKISYADSLKLDQPAKRVYQNVFNDNEIRGLKDHHVHKRKPKDDIILNLNSLSEEDIKKDDRYTPPRMKYDRKKHDRQKLHKKQKRKNKYEQWEMKGGYLKDYDEYSVTSSLGIDAMKNPDKKYLNPDFENYISKFTDSHNDQLIKIKTHDDKFNREKRAVKNEKGKKLKIKDAEWYEKRSVLRAEARKKLEKEMFGEISPNPASWYFRRMQKREQCRAQKDNSTTKKFSKQKLNFKMKH